MSSFVELFCITYNVKRKKKVVASAEGFCFCGVCTTFEVILMVKYATYVCSYAILSMVRIFRKYSSIAF